MAQQKFETHLMVDSYKEAEANVLRLILTAILKRDPISNDWADLTKIVDQSHPEWYILAYKNVRIGSIHFNYLNPTVFIGQYNAPSVTFNPS